MRSSHQLIEENINSRFIFLGTGGLLSKTVLECLLKSNCVPTHVFIQASKNSEFMNLTEIVCKKNLLSYSLVETVNTSSSLDIFRSINPKYAIIAGFGEIINKQLLDHFPFYNVHPGLLPENRGAYPVFWDIMNDKDHYGVTIHQINEKVDSGMIVKKSIIDLSEIVFGAELISKLYEFAGNCLIECISSFHLENKFNTMIETSAGKYFRKFNTNDLQLNPNEPVKLLYKKINRIQFYVQPRIDELNISSAVLLYNDEINTGSYSIRRINTTSSLLTNPTGVLLLKHDQLI